VLAVLDRYLMTEILKTMLAILAVLVLVVLVNNFIQLLKLGVAGVIDHRVIFVMLGLELLKELGSLIAPAFFFGVLMVLSRLYRDNEMSALYSCGVGRDRVFRAYVWAVFPVMLLALALVFWAKPWTYQMLKYYKDQQKSGDTAIVGLSPGKFIEAGEGGLVVYVERLSEDSSRLFNIFAQHRQQDSLGIVRADEGYRYRDAKTGDTFLVLERGVRYDGEPGEHAYRITHFGKYAIRVAKSAHEESTKPRSRPTAELWGSSLLEDRVEFQSRLFVVLAVPVFALLTLPLSHSRPRQGMAGKMVLALLIYFLYSNLQALSGAWMDKGVTPLWLGRWWVHLLMLMLAAGLLILDSLWFAEQWRKARSLLRWPR
jgi:lipopolysaccharide export system permease protein